MSTRKLCLIIVLGTMLLLQGCKNDDSAVQKIRIGHFPNVTHAQALVGRATNSFKNAFGTDYEVTFHTFNAGPSEIEAFFAGELDMGYIGPVPAINANIKSNGDILIIAGAANAGAIFIVPNNSDIYSIKDLANKRVAVPQFGNTQHLSLLNILSLNGLSDTTKGGNVEVLPASNPDIKTLLASGNIDAAYVPEPWGSKLIIEDQARILLDYDEVFRNGDYATAVVIASKAFIENHPEAVSIFLETHYKLTQEINSDLPSAKLHINSEIELLTGQKLSSEILDSVFEKLVISHDPIVGSVMAFMDISYDEGFIDKKVSSKDLFNLDIINKVLAANGVDSLSD